MGADPFTSIEDLEVKRGEPLSAHTTFRVGGPAAYFLVPRTWDALRAALEADARVPDAPGSAEHVR
mgnify:CR=1 FL=1